VLLSARRSKFACASSRYISARLCAGASAALGFARHERARIQRGQAELSLHPGARVAIVEIKGTIECLCCPSRHSRFPSLTLPGAYVTSPAIMALPTGGRLVCNRRSKSFKVLRGECEVDVAAVVG